MEVIVIGGGPSGMMASISAARSGHNVTILEKNQKLGKKLFITGKGRCNVTNNKDISEFFDNIPGNPHFLYSALYSFSNLDAISFFEEAGVKLKVERGDRLFPVSDKSSDVIKAFESELRSLGVKVRYGSEVTSVKYQDNLIKEILVNDEEVIKADHYIISTGGISYPQTGSTGDGYRFAKQGGHKVVTPRASLVAVTTEEEFVRDLSGLTLKNVELTIIEGKKKIYQNFGEMLFTHFGISGPIVLPAARVVHNKDCMAYINLKPALSSKELDKRIQKDFAKYTNKDFKNSLDELLPKKLIEYVIDRSGIDPNKKVNIVTKEERKKLVYIIQNFELKVTGTRPVAEAIITAGGISTKEIDPSTMKSKLIDNLSFCGEVIDVDANTGGYNLQIAYATGFLAGTYLQ